MKKRLLAILLTASMVISLFSVAGITAFAEASAHTGDYTFEFDSQADALDLKNASIGGGKLVMQNTTGVVAEVSATLNYQLESNKTYYYELTFNVTEGTGGTNNWVTPAWYAASNTGVTDSGNKFAITSGWGVKTGSTYPRTGTFTTGTITEDKSNIKLHFWIVPDWKFEIDSIKICDKTVKTGSYKFNFDNQESEIVKLTNGTVFDGKLSNPTERAGNWSSCMTAIFNYKLDSNKTYGYEVKGTVSNYSGSYNIQNLFKTATATSANGTVLKNLGGDNLSGNYSVSNGDYHKKGQFTTGDLPDGSNYLALFLNDKTTTHFEFDYVVIYEINLGDHTFNFDSEFDLVRTSNANLSGGKLVMQNTSGSAAEVSATLNYKLESNKTYYYELTFNVTEGTGGTNNWVTPRWYAAGESGATDANNRFDFAGWGVSKNGSYKKTNSFTTGTIAENISNLELYFWISTDWKFEIDSINIYDPTVKTGDYTFEFDYEKKDTVKLSNATIADGKLTLYDSNIGTGDNLFAIFNYELESNATYYYELDMTITNPTQNGKATRGDFRNATETGLGNTVYTYFMPDRASDNMNFPIPNDYLLKGRFTTGEVTEGNKNLAIYFWDLSGAKFEFDSIKIVKIKETPTPTENPQIISANGKEITLNAVNGCEYAFNEKEWQDSNVLTGFGAGNVTILMRVKATDTTFASDSVSITYKVHFPGDSNGDDKLNTSDLVTFKRYLLDNSTVISVTGADANTDGNYDLLDLVRTKKLFADVPETLKTVGGINYALAYNEDFNSSVLSSTQWKAITPYQNTLGENTRLTDSDNVSVADGKLIVGTSKDDGVYHGSEIMTTSKFSHGYYEAKLKVPAGTGYFPAFWGKLPEEFYPGKGYWNEIDIFECFGVDNRFTPAIHLWYDKDCEDLPQWIQNRDNTLNWVHNEPTESYKKCEIGLSHNNNTQNKLLSDEYHIFGCEWTDEKLAFYVDGVKYYEQAFNIGGQYSDYFTSFRNGEPINIYFSNLAGINIGTTEPNNILPNISDNTNGNSLEVEYFRYYVAE